MPPDDVLPLFVREEAAAEVGKTPELVSEFLLETLIQRPVIRERAGVSFMTAFAFRGPIKDVQIRALRILKDHLPTEFVLEASRRLAAVVVKLHGRDGFRAVVPVPCGHSMRPDCLSYQLAAGVAEHLKCDFAPVLNAPLRQGSSHPCESRSWRAPKVMRRPSGPLLVIDDVATTGRHMSLSLLALRKAGATAAGIAWIGSR
jgi:predicted amidophosphoribosyltransferase